MKDDINIKNHKNASKTPLGVSRALTMKTVTNTMVELEGGYEASDVEKFCLVP